MSRQYDVDVVLRDGSTVHLRPALSADLEAPTRFLSGLSEESKVFRSSMRSRKRHILAANDRGSYPGPVFGPGVACGAGGTAVELMKAVSVGLPPLSGADAERMLSGLVSVPLLEGYRGGSRVDLAALKGLLLRVSALAEDLPR
jgi:ATP-grasp domain